MRSIQLKTLMMEGSFQFEVKESGRSAKKPLGIVISDSSLNGPRHE
jgi:hypothetical protein